VTEGLLITAGLVYVLLGVVHGVLALRDVRTPQVFTPPDDALREAMASSTVAIHASANLWDAWLGFNLSHSVGLVVFGVVTLVSGASQATSAAGFAGLLAVATVYVALSWRFWFRNPLVGSLLGLVLISAAAIVTLL
jgi:hypothetical protein